ncbi:MAG: hypothetical protein LBS40_06950 [Burkholderiales bacterium]|nr:hypothetical protein [Burkholderiales bacterium]
MKKALKTYLASVASELDALRAQPDAKRARRLLERHLAQVGAFQHERLIHLIVTLFFALLLLVSFAGTLIFPAWQFFLIDALVSITLLFYIKHYFFLENHVQKLYPITDELYRFLEAENNQ